MDPVVYVILLLVGILGRINSTKFYVVAPESLKLNTNETIGIVTDDFGGLVHVYIQDFSKRVNITRKLLAVQPAEPQLFTVRLETRAFPPGSLSPPSPDTRVYLKAIVGNSFKEIMIPINRKSGYVFIQTDKPIYSPKEGKASIRIIAVNEDFLPSSEILKLQIKNPNGSVIEQKELRATVRYGNKAFITYVYGFPQFPVLGEWSANVYYGYNLTQISTARFNIQEYVLPMFTVELKTPDVILPLDTSFEIGVSAKYSYGKEVKGFVSYQIGVKNATTGEIKIYYRPTPQKLEDGSSKYTCEIRFLVEAGIPRFPKIANSRLFVQASVTDVATGNKEKAISTKTIITRHPFVASFERCLTDFWPGHTSLIEADITYINGKPAEGIRIRLDGHIRFTDSRPLLNISQTTTTDENGQFFIEIQTEVSHRSIMVSIEAFESKNAVWSAIGFLHLVPQSTTHVREGTTYLALARSKSRKLKLGDIFEKEVFFQPAERQNPMSGSARSFGLQKIYYVVLSRGRVQMMEKLLSGKVRFVITSEMVPNFRILVFKGSGDWLLVDSLKINVENECHPDAKVHIDPQFPIKEPGSNGKIIIQGTKGTTVGLMGVDEAVYALSKKDLLTNIKVFNSLADHDLGCGPGGGGSAKTILRNAGIVIGTNMLIHNADDLNYSCLNARGRRSKREIMERRGGRRKREESQDLQLVLETAENYNGFEKQCCILGARYGRLKNCDQKKAAAENYLTEEEYHNCFKAFLECCKSVERKLRPKPSGSGSTFFVMTGFPSFPGVGLPESPDDSTSESEDESNFIDADDEDDIENDLKIRSRFWQTWFFQDTLIGLDNKEELSFTLPDSITTWAIQAVSLSPRNGICVAEPTKLVSFKKIFLHLNMPYSVVRNEQIEIQATVFNYGTTSMSATVFMYGADGLCTGAKPDTRSERKYITITGLSSATITFPVVPLKAEDIHIKVAVLSNAGSDIVQRILHVIPEGIPQEVNIPVRLDPTNQQKREQRSIEKSPYITDTINPTKNLQVTTIELHADEKFVPGTLSCSITAVGNIYGPAVETSIDNPDSLLKEPGGCGEQNMIKLAPTLYTMKYLKTAGKLTAERAEKGYDYIRKGYANQLRFRKEDGSYSAFPSRNTSTWLTAFVVKVFCQASELIYIDKGVLHSGVRWLINNQQPDGSFHENYPLYSPDLMGGLQGKAPMTAFVLIALQECRHNEEVKRALPQISLLVKNRAISYLENYLHRVRSPLASAIVAYALSLSDSVSKQAANAKLLSLSNVERGHNWLYWKTENSAQDIQTAGYALLTQLLFNDLDRSMSIVNWLNTKQLESGSFKSTQDTVLALQAMSQYAIQATKVPVALNTNISASDDRNFERMLTFEEHNANVLQNIKVNHVGGKLLLKTSGNGMGSLMVTLRYNVLEPKDTCKFEIKVNVTSTKEADVLKGLDKVLAGKGRTGEKASDKKLRYNMELCIKYLDRRDAEMSIVDVGLFTGFVPDDEDLEKIVNDRSQLIQKYENTTGRLVFYLEKVPSSRQYCFSFHVRREFIVGNTQMSTINVYDYYNPDAKCIKVYKPDRHSPILRTTCMQEICQCAEGGCPPKQPFQEFRKLTQSESRERLMKSFCEDYDYVWNGKLSREMQNVGGFLNISFLVQQVIKPGIEQPENIVGKTRILLAQGNCPKLYTGVQYLLLGKDGERFTNQNGTSWYRYLLDQSSVVHLWGDLSEAANRELQRDLNHVIRNLLSKGCND